MYTILNPVEAEVFNKEVTVTLKLDGHTRSYNENIYYFDIAVVDLADNVEVCDAYTGSYTLHNYTMVITKFEMSDDILITESGGLQELVCKKTIEKFLSLARLNECKNLVIYTKDSITLETLFQYKFNLVKIGIGDNSVRAGLVL